MQNNIPFESHIESRVLVTIVEELKMVTKPFIGLRVFLRSTGYSAVVTEIDRHNKIVGVNIVSKDDVNDLISTMFPLTLTYEVDPIDPYQLDLGGSSKVTTLHNFKAFRDGEELLITKLEIEGGEFNPIEGTQVSVPVSGKEVTILVEAGGVTSVFIRRIQFLHKTYIGFSTVSDPHTISERNLPVILDNTGVLAVNELSVTHNSPSGAYLYIVSQYETEYVKTVGTVEFAIEGEVYINTPTRKVWRSNNKLSEGSWIINVKGYE